MSRQGRVAPQFVCRPRRALLSSSPLATCPVRLGEAVPRCASRSAPAAALPRSPRLRLPISGWRGGSCPVQDFPCQTDGKTRRHFNPVPVHDFDRRTPRAGGSASEARCASFWPIAPARCCYHGAHDYAQAVGARHPSRCRRPLFCGPRSACAVAGQDARPRHRRLRALTHRSDPGCHPRSGLSRRGHPAAACHRRNHAAHPARDHGRASRACRSRDDAAGQPDCRRRHRCIWIIAAALTARWYFADPMHLVQTRLP